MIWWCDVFFCTLFRSFVRLSERLKRNFLRSIYRTRYLSIHQKIVSQSITLALSLHTLLLVFTFLPPKYHHHILSLKIIHDTNHFNLKTIRNSPNYVNCSFLLILKLFVCQILESFGCFVDFLSILDLLKILYLVYTYTIVIHTDGAVDWRTGIYTSQLNRCGIV